MFLFQEILAVLTLLILIVVLGSISQYFMHVPCSPQREELKKAREKNNFLDKVTIFL